VGSGFPALIGRFNSGTHAPVSRRDNTTVKGGDMALSKRLRCAGKAPPMCLTHDYRGHSNVHIGKY
jgi:hypothetical protein